MSWTPSAIIAKAVPELGGPTIEAGDIEWASHIPAGQKLVQWLVDQCAAPESSDADGEGQLLEVDLGAALRAVALEDEELQIVKCAERMGTPMDGDGDSDTIHAPLAYAPPSRLRKHATYLDAETRLLDAESLSLKSRLRQTKQASQRAAHSISSLQAAIEREDAAIAHMQELLAELSVLADTTLSSGAHTALALLDTLAPPKESTSPDQPADPAVHPSLVSPTQSLTRLANLRTELTELHTSHLAQLPPQVPKELLNDSASLSYSLAALLREEEVGGGMGKLRDAAYTLELRRMYEALGREGAILDLDLEGVEDMDEEDVDVKASLEKAWGVDQAAALDAERLVLDSTIKAHHDALLPALRVLHTQLSAREQAVRAAEAWVGAFGIEVEGVGAVGGDAHNTKNIISDRAALAKEHELEFERELKSLILQHHHNHQGIDQAPLVLLDKAETLAELRRIQAVTEEGGDGWKELVQLRETLGSLSATHHPLLNLLYGTQDVQTNASPPFECSTEISQLEQRAREAVAKLEAGVGQGEALEKTLGGKRTQRKLGEFVDRWVVGSGGTS